MGLDESYLAPALNEYGDFELTAAERDAVRRAFAEGGGKATQRKIRRLAEEILGAPEGWLDTRKKAVKGPRRGGDEAAAAAPSPATRQEGEARGGTRETGLYAEGIAARDRWANMRPAAYATAPRRPADSADLRLGIHLRGPGHDAAGPLRRRQVGGLPGLSEKWKAIDPTRTDGSSPTNSSRSRSR